MDWKLRWYSYGTASMQSTRGRLFASCHRVIAQLRFTHLLNLIMALSVIYQNVSYIAASFIFLTRQRSLKSMCLFTQNDSGFSAKLWSLHFTCLFVCVCERSMTGRADQLTVPHPQSRSSSYSHQIDKAFSRNRIRLHAQLGSQLGRLRVASVSRCRISLGNHFYSPHLRSFWLGGFLGMFCTS